MKLLVMSCSATKRPTNKPLPGIDLYDGPMWRTLRANLDGRDTSDLRIMVLSARYGFIDADIAIPAYEQMMTPQRARELCSLATGGHQELKFAFRDADAVMFAAGSLYRDTMWRASGGTIAQIMKVSETDGGGIGVHRAQLAAWLSENFPLERIAA